MAADKSDRRGASFCRVDAALWAVDLERPEEIDDAGQLAFVRQVQFVRAAAAHVRAGLPEGSKAAALVDAAEQRMIRSLDELKEEFAALCADGKTGKRVSARKERREKRETSKRPNR